MILEDKKITVLGLGNQGIAWAQNLRDSGLDIKIALRAGSKSSGIAADMDFEVLNLKQAFIHSDILCMLTPDETHLELLKKYAHELDEGQSIVFAHGYTVHYGFFKTDKKIDIVLVSPKGTGKSVRDLFLKDRGVPALIAVEKDSTGFAWQTAKCLAEALGCHRAGIYKSTFREETEINLFSEQALYLSVLPEIILETYETLVNNGYSKEASYYETLHKLKTMSDIFHRNGIVQGFEKVSSVARFGGLVNSKRLLNDNSKKEIKKILKEIQDGIFAKKMAEESSSGFRYTKKIMEQLSDKDIELTHKRLKEKLFKNGHE